MLDSLQIQIGKRILIAFRVNLKRVKGLGAKYGNPVVRDDPAVSF